MSFNYNVDRCMGLITSLDYENLLMAVGYNMDSQPCNQECGCKCWLDHPSGCLRECYLSSYPLSRLRVNRAKRPVMQLCFACRMKGPGYRRWGSAYVASEHRGIKVDPLITHNDVFHERTKYIKNDCHFIHQHIFSEMVHLLYITF